MAEPQRSDLQSTGKSRLGNSVRRRKRIHAEQEPSSREIGVVVGSGGSL